MRIVTGGILHETSTFANGRTRRADFESGIGCARAEELFAKYRGANFCCGGFIEGAEHHGFELVPLLWCFAFPGGIIERSAYDELKGELLAGLKRECARGIDGVLLDLHGAMVVAGIPDGDGDLMAAVREIIGPDCPLVVTTDLHANHARARVDFADAILGYRTYPHVDMAERGRAAADLIVRAIRREVRPVSAMRQLPLFWSTACQVTAHPPMDEVMGRIRSLEKQPGILSATIATGFPWADIPEMGASIIVVADRDRALAQRAADELGEWIWQSRERWYKTPLTVMEALELGRRDGRFPIMLADMADNTGGGADGDSTEILQTFVDLDLPDALVLHVCDPEVAQQAHAAGVGCDVAVQVGGKSDARQGAPVALKARVMAVSDGKFRYDGPMYAGTAGQLGASAWLQYRGINVVVVSLRMQPLDQAFARSLGIDCARMKYIGIKSAAHFRSGFERLGGQIFNVNARAIHTHDFRSLPYRHRRPMYPLEIA